MHFIDLACSVSKVNYSFSYECRSYHSCLGLFPIFFSYGLLDCGTIFSSLIVKKWPFFVEVYLLLEF
jgi:hypothetical protein